MQEQKQRTQDMFRAVHGTMKARVELEIESERKKELVMVGAIWNRLGHVTTLPFDPSKKNSWLNGTKIIG